MGTVDKARRNGKYREYIEAFVVALFIALFLRTTVVQARVIPSGSMENTLLVGDYLFVNKFVYGHHLPFTDGRIMAIRMPSRGDIIVFDPPPFVSDKAFIKRVIAVPGETVEIRGKKVYIDGRQLVEDYAQFAEGFTGDILPGRDHLPPLRVPPGKLFVMGDNRDRSYDSRFWGYVDMNDVIGKAMIVGASVDLNRDIRWYEAWRYPEMVRWSRFGKVLR